MQRGSVSHLLSQTVSLSSSFKCRVANRIRVAVASFRRIRRSYRHEIQTAEKRGRSRKSSSNFFCDTGTLVPADHSWNLSLKKMIVYISARRFRQGKTFRNRVPCTLKIFNIQNIFIRKRIFNPVKTLLNYKRTFFKSSLTILPDSNRELNPRFSAS